MTTSKTGPHSIPIIKKDWNMIGGYNTQCFACEKERSNDEKEVKFKKVGKVQEFSLSFVVATSRHKNAGFYLGRVEFNILLKAEAYLMKKMRLF